MWQKQYKVLFIEILWIGVIYALISVWAFGEIKPNLITFIQGGYEQDINYDIPTLWNNGCIENATLLEGEELYTENANTMIRLYSEHQIRSIKLQIADFLNPQGTEGKALTTHFYYHHLDGEMDSKIMLMRIGSMSINLGGSQEGEYIIVPSNIEKSSVSIDKITLSNYKCGYLDIFYGLCALGICVGSFYVLGKKDEEKLNQKRMKKKIIPLLAICCSVGLIMIYLLYYFKLPHIIHPEAYGDVNHYANNPLSLFWSNFIPKIFDNTMIEEGLYRPRVLAYIWQYLDTNLLLFINRVYPGFGIKMPLTLMVILFMMLTWRYVWIKCYPNSSSVMGILFGIILLFIPNIQTATYFFLRSAKIITPVVLICLLNYSLSHLDTPILIEGHSFKIRKKDLLPATVIFLLCTLDEQIIATCVFIVALSLFISILNKKPERMSFIFVAALLFYVIYDKWWGRWLFEYFTPGKLQEHIHSISMVITDFNFNFIVQALEIYHKILLATFHNHIIIGIFIGCLFVLWLYIDEFKQKVIGLAIIGFSFALTVALLIGLPILYYYDDMILSIYFIGPILTFIYACVYIISKTQLHISFRNRAYGIKSGILLAFSIVLLLNITKVEECHLRHLGINGGSVQFRDKTFDLVYFNDLYESSIVTRDQYLDYMEGK